MRTLEEAGQSVRCAVQRGSYAEAQRLLAEYARAVNAALARAGACDESSVETVRRALQFLHWASRVVRSGRAHAAAELGRISAGRPYLAPKGQPEATIQLLG